MVRPRPFSEQGPRSQITRRAGSQFVFLCVEATAACGSSVTPINRPLAQAACSSFYEASQSLL